MRILHLLKQARELTVQAIAEAIGVSQVAVRKHLDALEEEKLVVARRVPLPRGRPTFAYRLTESAEAYFPQAYDRLAVELLDDILALDGEAKLGRLFKAQTERLSRSYEIHLADKDLAERVRELARLRDAEGYMTALEVKDGRFVLREHNCPIMDVAQRFPEACNCERDLFQRVLGRDVRRESSLVDGHPSCEYHIEEAAAGRDGEEGA